ncbi:MAG: hypothetical protein UY28_C0004G0022 [Candidatus Amesbacteria bacterium GW2011_GWB1_48_13]|uniref:Uncharacterized protein n=1 Tax=Candidatus Amesbacteria bacterium GW2011_GWB1_48_13 TaxID=1618362 RepID=A0A0G1UVJ8_9BACT|nr:MAG: hypothetical protein UY28_C0004G0022 [Candidatus Amesbacteria bacterium GW2011_GWB1_48_13]
MKPEDVEFVKKWLQSVTGGYPHALAKGEEGTKVKTKPPTSIRSLPRTQAQP